MIYNSMFEIPFNINEKTETYWQRFINETVNGNPRKAIENYLKFNQARENYFINQKNKNYGEIREF